MLLSKFTKYFRDEYEINFATDVGSFEMWIDDDEGKKAYFVLKSGLNCGILYYYMR